MRVRDALAASVNRGLHRLGIGVRRNRPMRDPVRLLVLKSKELGVETILDIGANTGQFAEAAYSAGWDGNLVSFEPILENYRRLLASASTNRRWKVAPPIALGSEVGEAMINVSENLASSSLLQVASASTDVVRETRQVRSEKVTVDRLDNLLQRSDWDKPFSLKIDTQGFELEVLRGASNVLLQTKVIMLEMSMAPLYNGAARFGDLANYLEDKGFRCIALTEGFADYRRNEVLQVDGVFLKRDD